MKNDLAKLEEKVEKKVKRRQKKKKLKMRVSGKSVFGLREMIGKKGK